jgi:hypothetical protein
VKDFPIDARQSDDVNLLWERTVREKEEAGKLLKQCIFLPPSLLSPSPWLRLNPSFLISLLLMLTFLYIRCIRISFNCSVSRCRRYIQDNDTVYFEVLPSSPLPAPEPHSVVKVIPFVPPEPVPLSILPSRAFASRSLSLSLSRISLLLRFNFDPREQAEPSDIMEKKGFECSIL